MVTGVQVTGLRFEGRRAVAVRYRLGGEAGEVAARREVLLSDDLDNASQAFQLALPDAGCQQQQQASAHEIVAMAELQHSAISLWGQRTLNHGRTIMTSCGAGVRMPRSSVATLPMRP